MTTELLQYLTLAAIFCAASGLVAAAFLLLRKPALAERIDNVIGSAAGLGPGGVPAEGAERWTEIISRAARPFARLSLPREGWETSDLRRRFIHAGWRSPSAPIIFFGMKTLFGLGLPAVFLVAKLRLGLELKPVLMVAGGAWLIIAGFFLPNLILNSRIARRQREIVDAFPDALDLLTICVEAGLGLDAALQRVASEMRLESEALAEELEMVTLEMRAGAGKDKALRNLALRTGVEDIESLVALLVQAERFGTSIGDSLRVQSDSLRVKRQQRAEEAAAKIAVKLVFPLVLCILPSIFIVVGGPAIIQIGKTFASVFGGG
jgi:tight adherence protein C